MANDPDDFIAGLHGYADSVSYHAKNQAWISRLGEFETPFPLENEADYARADAVRRMLSSLACYTFNTQHSENKRVWAMERVWANAVGTYNRRLLIRDKNAKLVARYLLWTYRFADIDPRAAFILARRHGVLRAVPHQDGRPPAVCVVGLDRAVGDNVFTVDRFGRHHRRSGRTIGRQALSVLRPLPWSGSDAEAFLSSLPELDPSYHVTEIGDHKHAARGSSFSRSAKHCVHDLLEAVADHEMRVIAAPVSPSPIDDGSGPLQLILLAA